MGLGRIRNPRVFCDRRRKSFQKSRSIFSPSQPNFTGIKAIIGVTSPFHSKLFRRESPESAKLVSSYYQARGKRCQKRVVGAGRPVREATNIAANADAQLDGKEIDPAGRKRRGPADQRKGTGPSMGDKSRLRNFTANCVCWRHTCAFEGSTWTGSEVAREVLGVKTLLSMQMG
jgi:hypothetical protein